MTDDYKTIDMIDGEAFEPARPGHIRLTHILYLLHAIGLVIGAWSQAATMIGAFVFGWTSIIAIILNYVKRDELKGTFLESHFAWQASTFWVCLIVMLIGVVLYVLLVGFLVNWLLFGLVGLWAIYRIIKGWLALKEGKPVL
ncbi:membrane protein [Uliginosibacterium flavum]|uniref:Transmembrane protein n=2 Tax=Uliginosibacterium flavum TaxID=1396831 RepID=A0ABV2TGK5_9RHOO